MNHEGCILTDTKYNVMKKYRRPKVVEEQDRELVYDLAGQHLMALGFREGDEGEPLVQETVRLTPLGKRTLSREAIMRNLLSRLFYRSLSTLTS